MMLLVGCDDEKPIQATPLLSLMPTPTGCRYPEDRDESAEGDLRHPPSHTLLLRPFTGRVVVFDNKVHIWRVWRCKTSDAMTDLHDAKKGGSEERLVASQSTDFSREGTV